MRLLSVDWDFFFPVPELDREFLYDWGHREDIPFMLEGIWDIRASDFMHRGKILPDTSGDEEKFWDRFKFAEGATLYYADSHCRIFSPEVADGASEVWNFDAHHDAFHTPKQVIKAGVVSCEDWAIGFYLNSSKIRVIYPGWGKWLKKNKPTIVIPTVVDSGKPFRKSFDKIFLCRSGAWTPTWIEDKFWKFIDDCPVSNIVKLDNMSRRHFSMKEAKEIGKQLSKQFSIQRGND